MLPWLTFLIGLGGSAHCVSMCGGLAIACAPTTKSNLYYQLGRLFGYSFLGLFSGYIGSFLIFNKSSPYLSLIPASLISALLIYWGLCSFRGKKIHIPMPSFFNKLVLKIWSKLLTPKGSSSNSKSAISVGLISIFLPCGLLYGVVIALAAFQNTFMAMISMMTFWLGTAPAMSFAPQLIQKIFKPLSRKLPKVTSMLLISIGLFTLSSRVYHLFFLKTCH